MSGYAPGAVCLAYGIAWLVMRQMLPQLWYMSTLMRHELAIGAALLF